VAVGCGHAKPSPATIRTAYRIPTYIDRIKVGHIVPARSGASCRNRTTTVIDGHWGFDSRQPKHGADD